MFKPETVNHKKVKHNKMLLAAFLKSRFFYEFRKGGSNFLNIYIDKNYANQKTIYARCLLVGNHAVIPITLLA